MSPSIAQILDELARITTEQRPESQTPEPELDARRAAVIADIVALDAAGDHEALAALWDQALALGLSSDELATELRSRRGR